MVLTTKCVFRQQVRLLRIFIVTVYFPRVTAPVIIIFTKGQFLLTISRSSILSSLISRVILAPDHSLISRVILAPEHRIIRAVTKKCKFNSSGRNCTLTKQKSTAISQPHHRTYKMTRAQNGNWQLITSFSSLLLPFNCFFFLGLLTYVLLITHRCISTQFNMKGLYSKFYRL